MRSGTCASLLLSLIVAAGPRAEAAQVKPVVVRSNTERYPLVQHLRMLADPSETLTIEEVTHPSRLSGFGEVTSLGFGAPTLWFYVDLQSDLSRPAHLLLEIGYPLLDRIEFYSRRLDGSFSRVVTGDTLPFGERVIAHYNFLFPVILGAGEQQRLFMRVQSKGSMHVPAVLWTERGFWDHERDKRIVLGIYCGLMLIAILYNLLLFFSTRDRNYLFFALFVLGMFIWSASNEGLAQAYLWPDHPWWANVAVPFSLWASCLFALATTTVFLDLRHKHMMWWTVARIGLVVSALGLPLSLALPYTAIITAASVWAALLSVLFWLGALFSWFKGYRPARYYVAAWSLFFVGTLLFSLARMGLLSDFPLVESGWMIGFVLNIIFVSIALTDRINLLEQDKSRAQLRALQIQQQAAAQLKTRVEEKKIDLQRRSEELAQAYARLAEYDRAKSNFFANVSHELRTPLTLILTPLERLMAGEDLSETARSKLRTMQGNAQRLLRLVNQLLDFSRLESNSVSLVYEQVDLRTLLEPVVQAFVPFARSKELRLTINAPEHLPPIYIDCVKLEKVVSNLLSNACMFTEPGGKVLLDLSSDDRALYLAVEDTGIGIDEQDQQRIFERFQQVEGGRSRGSGGTGIGLALSKELVELMGAELTLQSELGFGSRFTVRLPLGVSHIQDPSLIRKAEPAEADGTAERAESAAQALMAASKADSDTSMESAFETDPSTDDSRPLLLVVEDNADMRTLVAEICQQEFSVIMASDGQQGLELTRQHHPALVISDVMMPRMDGQQMLRQIRADPELASTPVILLTAKTDPSARLEGLEGGADDYLTKPFDSRELLARARILVRLKLQEQQQQELGDNLQQEVVSQATALERSRILASFLPREVARMVMEGKLSLEAQHHRRRLTVFVLELRGFNTLVEAVDPEDLAVMLQGFYSEMMGIALAHGATVDRLVRDRVVGFFGAPTSRGPEEDALCSIRMALKMWQGAEACCTVWRESLGIRPPVPTMLVTSGHAAVGTFGSSHRLQYTAIGGAMDEADGLLDAVGSGEVVCSQATWSLLADEVQGHPCGEVSSTASASKPTTLYRLAGPIAGDAPEAATLNIKSASESGTASASDRGGATSGSPGGAEAPAPGTVLLGRYQIIRELGQGGMGAVFQAEDLKLNSTVAVKVLRGDLGSADAVNRKRLHREVRLARLLNHRNIGKVHGIEEWGGRDFIIMEYIEGTTLTARIKSSGGLPQNFGKKVLLQLCAGLGAAHASGIIHCDLKPSNIMIEPGGRVVLLDFGIARWMYSESNTLTKGLDKAGTPRYMAPERFDKGQFDHRADIYSLGIVAYEMLWGNKIFPVKGMAEWGFHHVHTKPRDLKDQVPDLDQRMARAIMTCLEKDPFQRFQTTWEMHSYLEESGADIDQL